MAFLAAYPVWSTMVITPDVIVIYALVVLAELPMSQGVAGAAGEQSDFAVELGVSPEDRVAYGLMRVGPVALQRGVPGRHEVRVQRPDGLRDPGDLRLLGRDEGAVHDVAVPGYDSAGSGLRGEQPGQGVRPVEREAVVAVAGRRRFLDEIPGEHHACVGNDDHQVAVGVAATEVAQRDLTVAEVECGQVADQPVRRC